MDFDEYVAARYGRLIEHAVLLGCAEGEAGTVVDRVLVAERRRIRKAKDPDPLVREALERHLRGEPTRRRRTGPIAAIGLVAAVALVGAVVTYQPAPREVTVPSLFGYDGPHATTYLHQLGLDVQVDRVSGCEPLGQVIGSQPAPGGSAQEGSTVQVFTALPTDSFCLPDYSWRVDAWAFIGFALGASPPSFAPEVGVLQAASTESTDGSGDASRPPMTALTTQEAADRDRWGDVLEQVARASRTPAPTPGGMPALDVAELVPPGRFCGRARPAVVGRRTALRVQIDTTSDQDARCPVTVDLYRTDDGAIDTVVLYPAA